MGVEGGYIGMVPCGVVEWIPIYMTMSWAIVEGVSEGGGVGTWRWYLVLLRNGCLDA